MEKPIKFITKTIELVSAAAYALFLPLLRRTHSPVVVYYHGVRKEDIRQFEKQMAYLACKCKVVRPSLIKTASVEGSGPLAAITFDDAFTSVLENAVPILKKYDLTAGIFVPAGNLGLPPRWPMAPDCDDRNEIVMNRDQIAELSREGFEILSHTMSHPILTQIDADSLGYELLESRKRLEEIIQGEVSGVSYPNGACNKAVCIAAKDAGYTFGFTVVPETADCSAGDMTTGRFSVSPKESMLRFRLKVSGAYQVSKYLRGLKGLLCRSAGVVKA